MTNPPGSRPWQPYQHNHGWQAPPPPPPPVQWVPIVEWQYRTIKVLRTRRGDRKLTYQLSKGWEYVDRYKQLNAYDRVTIRRPKPVYTGNWLSRWLQKLADQ